jgi:polar amino acid transport system substrate-binding protein
MRALLLPAVVLIASQISGGALGQSAPTSEIAPSGKLRAALIGGNPVLVTKKPDGGIGGVSVDLGKFIAEKLGVPFDPVVYADPESYTRSFGKGEWDIAIGPRRSSEAQIVDYSPNFMVLDHIYIAAPGREFADASQVDRPGVKIAVIKDGAPDVFLSRTLKSAELVRIASGRDDAIEALKSGKADVYGSNAPIVYRVADGFPTAKIVLGHFNLQPMAIAIPKGRSAAAQGKLAEIVNEAKATGLVQKAIEQAGLRGVRVAPN